LTIVTNFLKKNPLLLLLLCLLILVLSVCNPAASTPNSTPVTGTTPACFVTYPDTIAFFPDNNRILIRANTGVQIFNLQTMQEEIFIAAPTSLNGSFEIRIWHMEDGKLLYIGKSECL
jgi:hypothetical protein